MTALDGTGGVVRLADGDHAVSKMRTRRLLIIEQRYGGLEAIQKLGSAKLLEVTAALVWAADLAKEEDDAYDLLDGVPLLEAFKTLMVELIRSYAGDAAADSAVQGMADGANGQGTDPTLGPTAPLEPAPSPSLS